MPLANDLVADAAVAATQDRFPLTLAFCPQCSLVQLRETVDPERLFRDYVYLSSNSASFVAHAGALAERLVRERGLGPASRVVEIASNDGYLLQHYLRPAYRCWESSRQGTLPPSRAGAASRRLQNSSRPRWRAASPPPA